MMSPLPPKLLEEILNPGKIPDPMEGVPPEC